jgi:DNA-binding NarL/FixJ family response regulator
MPCATVLLVDDDAGFRATARRLLEAADLRVVAESEDGEHALSELLRVRPDAALVDVRLPDTDGLTLAREFKRVASALRIVLTSSDRDAAARATYDDGIVFVPKCDLAVTDLAAYLRP